MSGGHGPGPPPEISVTSTGGGGWTTSAAANQYGQWARMIGATRFGIAGGVDLNGSLPSERSRSASKA
jgi:hypothetical protein